MRESFNIFHWEFYQDKGDPTVYVYEKRSGDVIGYIPNVQSVREIENDLSQDFTEEEVYLWIDNNIEWY